MRKTSVLIFEILERAWATRNCALIDMKIEFGIDLKGKFQAHTIFLVCPLYINMHLKMSCIDKTYIIIFYRYDD